MSCTTDCSGVTKASLDEVSALSEITKITEESCFTDKELQINIFAALKGIQSGIQVLAEGNVTKASQSGILFFKVAQGSRTISVPNVDYVLSRAPLSYKVVGFGISCHSYSNLSSSYKVKLYDFTTLSEITSQITLNSINLYAKVTNAGDVIGSIISNGHEFGVKVEYDAGGQADAFTVGVDGNISVFIHVIPVELN